MHEIKASALCAWSITAVSKCLVGKPPWSLNTFKVANLLGGRNDDLFAHKLFMTKLFTVTL